MNIVSQSLSSSAAPISRAHCLAMDAADTLASRRDLFALPQDVIYLDGNSLGAMPKAVPSRMTQAIEQEWAVGLIRSWNDADWYPAPQRVGGRIASLIGAKPNEVIVADSTSVNLFKLLVSALRMRAGRNVILGENGNFPTDAYVASGVAELTGAQHRAVAPADVMAALTEDVAVLTLTHVNYKSGQAYDMAAVTRRAHEVGALVIWDLAHTAGAMPCDLNGCEADFAVGCGYKYLNGGPGAPSFVFVAERHHESVRQPITGWHGHAKPFEFTQTYVPAPGIDRMLVGTAPQMGLFALEAALTAFDGVDMQALRAKSLALTELFIRLVDQELSEHGFGLATPREAGLRGSQVSLTHAEGYAIVQALIARGVIGDFRAPDILRFGFAALYLSHADVWDAIATLKDVMVSGIWRSAEFMARKAVT
ncbi:kynureninase [Roseateles koreensis]|uniref:Kynureninase n=1 Tax=Roseateles koreensis TaxID=2987526 RepID=A0ABT5KQX6_9BURK|nr:kynureninase [Roseateles koreensis]MDC8785236.1 kynureninase [Roseateles koreensis]